MCIPLIAAIAVVGAAAAVAGTISAADAADDAADNQNAFNRAKWIADTQYAQALDKYNHDVYDIQVSDRKALLDWDAQVYNQQNKYRDQLVNWDQQVYTQQNKDRDGLVSWDQKVYDAQVGDRNKLTQYDHLLESIQGNYRNDLITWNNSKYDMDVSYVKALESKQKEDVKRQDEHTHASEAAIKDDYITKLSTLAERSVEETVSSQLQMDTISRQARTEAAKRVVAIGENGIDGNSVNGVINDVFRQEGEGHTIVRMNYENMARQLNLQARGFEAEANTAINAIPIQTFAPIQGVQAPSPISPVNPAAPRPQVQLPSPRGVIQTPAPRDTVQYPTPRPQVTQPAPVQYPVMPGTVEGPSGFSTVVGVIGNVAGAAGSYYQKAG